MPIGTQHDETTYPSEEEQLREYVYELLDRRLRELSRLHNVPSQAEQRTIDAILDGPYRIEIVRD